MYLCPKILFPFTLWNHFDTDGPRTNNHIEGENAALKRFINVDSPDIYSLILCLKDIESLVAIKYLKNQQVEKPQKRRAIDVERDKSLAVFKAEYNSKTLQLYSYLSKIAHLFYFTDAKKPAVVHQIAPISLLDAKNAQLKVMHMELYDRLQQTNFQGAQFIHGLTKSNVKTMMNHLVSQYRRINSNFLFDSSIHQVVSKYINFLDDKCEQYYEPVLTTGDGNCFYNAISMVLFGHENYSKLLRLANVYILSLYDVYF